MTESAVVFGNGRSLVGVVTEPAVPAEAATRPVVIFLNSGLIHRVGPNRLHVRLARLMASKGLVAFRFDLSGIGDSRPAADRLPVRQRWVAETRSAMDFMEQTTGARSFVLVGNCSGAAASFFAAHADPRVVGLGLVNPQGRRVLRYYFRLATASRASWLRLLGGRAKLPSLPRLRRRSSNPGTAPKQGGSIIQGIESLAQRGVDLLLVSSEWDPGYDYYHRKNQRRLLGAAMHERLVLDVIPGANHEIGLLANQDRLVEALDGWTSSLLERRWR